MEPTCGKPGIVESFHRIIGAATAVYGSVHLAQTVVQRNNIHPFTATGWLNEHLTISLILVVLGVEIIIFSPRPNASSHVGALVAAFLLALVSALIYSRYFWRSIAAIELASLLDVVLIASQISAGAGRRWGLFTMWVAFTMFVLSIVFVGLGVAMAAPVGQSNSCGQAIPLVAQAGDENVVRQFDVLRVELRARGLEDAYCDGVFSHLASIESARATGLERSADVDLRVVRFEHFKIDHYLRSGVAPKAYFGFFDEQGDTAAHEITLRRTIIEAAPLINDFAKSEGLDIDVSEQELAITFLAEGGALLLTTPEESPDRVHPVRGVGLDDFRKGFARYPRLVQALDEKFQTRLRGLLIRVLGKEVLVRPMTFREAIVGTGVMYLFEKEIAVRLLAQEGVDNGARLPRTPLRQEPLDIQFILTSLVYNSGMMFSRERIEQIHAFETGEYLAEVNERSDRPKLAVFAPAVSLRVLQEKRRIPPQLTSWSAVYHILQRYGAWVAIERFSDTFEDGKFRNRS